MSGRWLIAVVTLLMLNSVRSRAQYVRHFDTPHFLKANNVYHIARDRKGFLWFCTDQGLIRFDGKEQTRFTTQDGLADNSNFNIYEDKEGRIWPYSYNGRYCFIRDGKVFNEDNTPYLRSLPTCRSYVTGFATDSVGIPFLLFNSGALASLRKGRWSWMIRPPAHPAFKQLQLSDSSAFTLITGNGISIITGAGRSYRPLNQSILTAAKTSFRVAGDASGVCIYDAAGISHCWQLPRLNKYTLISACVSDDHQYLFCGSTHGLDIINMRNGARRHFFDGEMVTACEQDAAGNYWIGTRDNGVYRISQNLGDIKLLAENADGLVIGADETHLSFHKGTELYGMRSPADSQAKLLASGIFPYQNLLCMAGDYLLFNDLLRLHGVMLNRQTKRSQIINRSLYKKVFSDGVHFYTYAGPGASRFATDGGNKLVVRGEHFANTIRAGCRIPGKDVIYLTDGHFLYRRSFGNAKPDTVLGSTSLSDVQDIYSVHEWLVMTTNRNVLLFTKPQRPKPTVFRMNTRAIISSVNMIDMERLMIKADDGDWLLRYGQAGFRMSKINYPFPEDEYESIHTFQGHLVVRVDRKVFLFDKALLNRYTLPPRLYLNHVTVNGTVYTTPDVHLSGAGRLNINILLGALRFGAPLRGIRYRISNSADATWQQTTGDNISVVLQTAGTYAIELQPLDGKPSDGFTLHIDAKPPFFQTRLFYVLCALAFVLLCLFGFRRVMRYRSRRFNREFDYLRLEHKSVNALLNPHFLFNAINNIQGLINSSRKEDAAEYLAVLSRLVRQNLENLEDSLVTLENELALIKRYIILQNMRFGNSIELHIEPGSIDTSYLYVPPLLLHTFVENAIVHGYKDRSRHFNIAIKLTSQGNGYLKITLTDNGVGFDTPAQKRPGRERRSMGIAFNKERLDRINRFYKLQQQIVVTGRPAHSGNGTEVIILVYEDLKALFDRQQITIG